MTSSLQVMRIAIDEADKVVAASATESFDQCIGHLKQIEHRLHETFGACSTECIQFHLSCLERRVLIAIRTMQPASVVANVVLDRLAIGESDAVRIYGLFCMACEYIVSRGDNAAASELLHELREWLNSWKSSLGEISSSIDQRWPSL